MKIQVLTLSTVRQLFLLAIFVFSSDNHIFGICFYFVLPFISELHPNIKFIHFYFICTLFLYFTYLLFISPDKCDLGFFEGTVLDFILKFSSFVF